MMARNAPAAAAIVSLLAPAAWGAPAATPRHLLYLHGRIVQEEQSARPRSARFGFYELESIKDALRGRGFFVSDGIRPKAITESEAADRVVEEVRGLLGRSVPPDRVTVVGASMGGAIALLASARLQNPGLRFCVLGACLSRSVAGLRSEEGRIPSGHVLSIREASDDVVGECATWRDDLASPSLRAREIVLHTGRSHGFLYQPLPEWVEPVVRWAKGDETE
jgi:pimeloyl-ACP methyl ester carboxylesterase